MKVLLKLDSVSKQFGERRALRDFSISIDQGEIVGLLGPNGAGKSTAVSIMAGLCVPSSGGVYYRGSRLSEDPLRCRRLFGLVPQELALYEKLTVSQNLFYFARIWGLKNPELNERVQAVLEIAQLQDRAHDVVLNLSGGMKRRLNLCVGLIHAPSILFLDEPTVGVDPQSRQHIFETIRSLRNQQGLAVLYTSHYMEEVETLCDRVVILRDGAIVEQGTVSEVVQRYSDVTLEIELTEPTFLNAVVSALQGLGSVCTGQAQIVVLENVDCPLSKVIETVENQGAKIKRVSNQSSRLESAFLRLTRDTRSKSIDSPR